MKIYVTIIKLYFTSRKVQQEDLFELKSKKKIPQYADVFVWNQFITLTAS